MCWIVNSIDSFQAAVSTYRSSCSECRVKQTGHPVRDNGDLPLLTFRSTSLPVCLIGFCSYFMCFMLSLTVKSSDLRAVDIVESWNCFLLKPSLTSHFIPHFPVFFISSSFHSSFPSPPFIFLFLFPIMSPMWNCLRVIKMHTIHLGGRESP